MSERKLIVRESFREFDKPLIEHVKDVCVVREVDDYCLRCNITVITNSNKPNCPKCRRYMNRVFVEVKS